jgi:hypothetical protein
VGTTAVTQVVAANTTVPVAATVPATAAVAVTQPDTSTARSTAQEKADTAAETATATAAAVVAAVEQSAAASARIEQLEAKVEQQRAVLRLYQQLSSLVIAIKPAASDEAPTKVLAYFAVHSTVNAYLTSVCGVAVVMRYSMCD